MVLQPPFAMSAIKTSSAPIVLSRSNVTANCSWPRIDSKCSSLFSISFSPEMQKSLLSYSSDKLFASSSSHSSRYRPISNSWNQGTRVRALSDVTRPVCSRKE